MTVIPLPEKDAVAPLWKPVPVMVTVRLDRPCRYELGLNEMIVGRAFTVNALASEATPASRFVTVTLRDPTVAVVEIEMLTVRCVEFVLVTELTVIPVPEKVTDEAGQEPLAKLEPVITTFWLAVPWPRELGPRPDIEGAALTLNPPTSVERPASGLMTVTSRDPVVAPDEIDRLTVSRKALFRVTELTVIPGPENWTDDGVQVPLWKFNPTMKTFWLTAPRPIEPGRTSKGNGAELMARQLAHVALVGPAIVAVTFREAVEALPETEMLAVRWVGST